MVVRGGGSRPGGLFGRLFGGGLVGVPLHERIHHSVLRTQNPLVSYYSYIFLIIIIDQLLVAIIIIIIN